MSDSKKQKTAEDQRAQDDQPAAESPGHGTMTTQATSGISDFANMYKFRNGKGDVLQTPKKSSIARAQALLAPSSPCHLTITGWNWPVAAVVSRRTMCRPKCAFAAFTKKSHNSCAGPAGSVATEICCAAGHRDRYRISSSATCRCSAQHLDYKHSGEKTMYRRVTQTDKACLS